MKTSPVLPPTNTVLPTISGLLQDGGLLSVATGIWEGTEPIKYAYQWQLCNSSGASCSNIEEALGSTLKLSPTDVGKTLKVIVTATNARGSTQASSSATSLIKAILPKNTSLPTISGVLEDGQLLSAKEGGWEGTAPITYSYQWQLCNALKEGCENAAEGTNSTFLLKLLDVGHTLRVVVTATNARGSKQASSAITGLIEGLLLAPSAGPSGASVTISGSGVSAATSVHFGSAEASEVEVNSPTEITAQAPPGSGTVPVTVTVPEGTTASNPADQFSYR